MALVSSHTIPLLLELLAAGKLDTSALITHGKPFSFVDFGSVEREGVADKCLYRQISNSARLRRRTIFSRGRRKQSR
jgi:hypothetical protein